VGAAGVLFWSGVKLRYRERSVSVQLVEYCGAVWYCGTESGLPVCSWWCILERCGIVVQRVVYCVQLVVYCGAVRDCGTESGLKVFSWWCFVERCGIVVQRAVCQCAAGGVLWSGVKLRCRERSVSVQLVVYCGAVW
jgi:hypothetical protein